MTDKTNDQPSYLEMSDEDMLNAAPPSTEGFVLPDGDATGSADSSAASETPEAGDETPPGSEGSTPPLSGEEEDGDEGGDSAANEDDTAGGVKEGEAGADDKGKAKEGEEVDPAKAEADNPAEVTIDYKAEYEKLFAPFKANGREIQIKSPEDAIALMQMGANYNKKMAALKPNLALMKLLEKNDLLDEGKLSFLIDVDKKNPEAISKLLQDSGLDPLDLGAEKASGYKPNTYAVSEKEVELDGVLDEIKDSTTYHRTIDLVGNKWDVASKKVISDQPGLLKVINGHMQNGVYDIISAEVERERLFGRLSGLSDLEAYKQAGDAINARGGFKHLDTPSPTAPTKTVITAPQPDQAAIDKLKDKRRAASSTKSGAPKDDLKDFNPLNMTDEEFSKLDVEKLIKR